MRAIVLVLLGGAVLYLVWNRFGADDAAAAAARMEAELPEHTRGVEPEAEAGAGRMRSPAEIEASLAAAPPLPETVPGETLEQPAPPAESAPGPSKPLNLNWEVGDLVAQGSLLLHEVERLPAMLSGPWSELSENRKKLLFGYGLLIRGQHERAAEVEADLREAQEISAAERELLRSVLEGGGPRPLAASARGESALLLGARMALLGMEGDDALQERRYAEAAEIFSDLLQREIDAPWPAERATLRRLSQSLHEAQSAHRWSKDGSWRSFDITVQAGDHLVAIRKRVIADRPGLNLCTGLISRANQLGKYVHEGNVLRIPSEEVRTVVDLSAHWLLYFHGDEVVAAWEVAIGREDSPTTHGKYTVGEKVPEPPWFRPGGDPVLYGDPENPLGTRWIAFDGSNGLGFHGTWEPDTVGTAASDGCIRMRNADVEELFEILPRGTQILVKP